MEIIKPSLEEISKRSNNEFNRYEMVIATAKTAHLVIDEYVRQRTEAEKKINLKETDKPLTSMISKDLRDEKAVRNAITLICDGDVSIVRPDASAKATEEETADADGVTAE